MSKISQCVITFGFALASLQLLAPSACAQFGTDRINRPLSRPTVSPYVNMLRGTYGSNSAAGIAANYYGAVRPQQQFYAQNEHLTDGLNRVQMQQNQPQQRDSRNGQNSIRKYRMGITGHSASFMTIGGGGGGAGGGGAQGGGGQGGFGGDDSGGQSLGGFSGHSAGFGSMGGSSRGF